MGYGLENALFQWEEGERRMRELPDSERARQERAVAVVLGRLRRRLGSTFSAEELAALYGEGTDWAAEAARAEGGASEPVAAVDAAFGRYAREASDWAGGRYRPPS